MLHLDAALIIWSCICGCCSEKMGGKKGKRTRNELDILVRFFAECESFDTFTLNKRAQRNTQSFSQSLFFALYEFMIRKFMLQIRKLYDCLRFVQQQQPQQHLHHHRQPNRKYHSVSMLYIRFKLSLLSSSHHHIMLSHFILNSYEA